MRPKFNGNRLLLRIDSACSTGQVFGDLTCDCEDQLNLALDAIRKRGEGVVIRIDQHDGRGMGSGFKFVSLLVQQELGYNTVDAFKALGDKLDDRDYYGVVAILRYLGAPENIELLTNNPAKLKELEENGYLVTRVSIQGCVTGKNKKHLAAKRRYLGHMLEV